MDTASQSSLSFMQKVLLALYRSKEWQVGTDRCYLDTDIENEGARAFGPGWAGAPSRAKHLRYEFYPRIALTLGKLRVRGLAERQSNSGSQGGYGVWKLTGEGQQAAKLL